MSKFLFSAMQFAREAHAGQLRKYTAVPYFDHLAEVVGIVSSVAMGHDFPQFTLATAWLHDCMEDCGVSQFDLDSRFGRDVAMGVWWLSDLETEGNRARRKEAARDRLSGSPVWVQDIKLADLISNTGSIVQHDPKFAAVYLEEKRLLLEVMNQGDHGLYAMAQALVL